MVLPEYAQLRAAQKPPDGCCIPVEAAPTIAYGDPAKARVATIGLNPGHRHQREARRGAQPGVAPNAQEEMYGYDYFEVVGATPGFFNPLEKVIVECGASYLDGSACHLDLAQWPTSKRWRDLPPGAQAKLLDDGTPFVGRQLEENPGIKLLLGDGKTVMEQMKKALPAEYEHIETVTVDGYRYPVRVFVGEVLGKRLIGWNWPLIRKGIPLVEKLAQRVGELARR